MQQGKPGTPIVYEVFDLLELEGEPLVDLPLASGASGSSCSSTVATARCGCQRSSRTGRRSWRRRRRSAWRGSSPSAPTRRTGRASARASGLKIKTHGRQEFVIVGYTKGQGRRLGRFGALVLGTWQETSLSTQATSAPASPTRTSTSCSRSFARWKQKDSAFRDVPKMPKVRQADVVWVKPELVAEVEFVE
jgi:bifunctional non-homologous end joining protein LigD